MVDLLLCFSVASVVGQLHTRPMCLCAGSFLLTTLIDAPVPHTSALGSVLTNMPISRIHTQFLVGHK